MSNLTDIEIIRAEISKHLCYTELVYHRINQKLNLNLDPTAIEALCSTLVANKETLICRRGKNYYLTDSHRALRLTINSNTYRVITADLI